MDKLVLIRIRKIRLKTRSFYPFFFLRMISNIHTFHKLIKNLEQMKTNKTQKYEKNEYKTRGK